jgi:tRNA pseudouridine32 synthase/23S rRNA pseudouridine746 synthase
MLSPPVLYRDERLVILDKPAGLPSHAGRAGGASAEDWFAALSRRAAGPWLAHRLDADTAGCLVVALRKSALLAVQALFAAGQVDKRYWALVAGAPPAASGVISRPIAKVRTRTAWRMVAREDGQAAVTDWRVLGSAAGLSWLELRPRTGRTHQLRVHCASLGCPILGDPLYGPDPAGRLQLLARSVALPLTPPAYAEAPPPAHMQSALAQCGWR